MSGDIFAMISMLALSIPIAAIVTRHKRAMAEIEVRRLEAEAQSGRFAGSDRTDRLEERVRVLERIVTEESYDVASQIEALRDSPAKPPREARPKRLKQLENKQPNTPDSLTEDLRSEAV